MQRLTRFFAIQESSSLPLSLQSVLGCGGKLIEGRRRGMENWKTTTKNWKTETETDTDTKTETQRMKKKTKKEEKEKGRERIVRKYSVWIDVGISFFFLLFFLTLSLSLSWVPYFIHLFTDKVKPHNQPTNQPTPPPPKKKIQRSCISHQIFALNFVKSQAKQSPRRNYISLPWCSCVAWST